MKPDTVLVVYLSSLVAGMVAGLVIFSHVFDRYYQGTLPRRKN